MEILEDQDWRKESGLLFTGRRIFSPEAEKRIWGEEGFRVFLSHKDGFKKETAELKKKLKLFGVTCFVAHEDIKPTKEWQDEIENALSSMDAFVALITEDFHDSVWTDQEVGFALGRGVPIIPVKLGKNPYGFLAKVQALSCFSGTGFTTKESELVVSNPQRRRIASVLIILGNAGLVTMVATFANTLRPSMLLPQFKIPFLHLVIPSRLLSWINLVIVCLGIYVIYRIFTHSRLTKKITEALRKRIVKSDIIKLVSFEELLIVTGGYGVSSIEVCQDSPILNRSLLDAELRKEDINILVIERSDQVIPNPSASIKLTLGDKLVCFGKLENIRNKLCPNPK